MYALSAFRFFWRRSTSTLDRMQQTLVQRTGRVLGWFSGATAAGVGWYAISVYGLGFYDEAYGPLAIFQIGSALAVGFAVLGLCGYGSAVAVYGAHQTVPVAAIAGALFFLAMQLAAFGLGHAFPSGVGLLPVAFLALALGAASSVPWRSHEV